MQPIVYRTLIGTLLLIGSLSAIWLSQGPFSLIFPVLCAVILSLALFELYHLCEAKGYPSMKYLGITSTILYLVAIWIGHPLLLEEAILFFTLFFGFCYYFYFGDKPLLSLAMTLFGIGYLTLPLSSILRIIYLDDGKLWVIYLLLIKAATDGGGYLFGSMLGRKSLAPSISPHKTWEGAACGTLLAILITICFNYLTPHPLLGLSQAVFLAVSLAIFMIIGDLAESLIKRDIGVKDSAHIPGVGGVLDTIDSLVFATPFLYFFLQTLKAYS
ncbi:MAG: phosphatidate cytidylyltransferase [Waddliaceae bacterium]